MDGTFNILLFKTEKSKKIGHTYNQLKSKEMSHLSICFNFLLKQINEFEIHIDVTLTSHNSRH